MNDGQAETKDTGFSPGRWGLAALIVAAFAAFYLSGAHRHVSFENLKENRDLLLHWRNTHFALAALSFMAVYCAATALSLPFGFWISLAGGFMFGTVNGALFIILGATAGAVLVFLAARYLFADYFHAKAGPMIRKMEAGFRENSLSYLLALRFIPFFPFWAVNLVPAFLGVRMRNYFLATFFGIAPGATVMASLGNGLGTMIDAGRMPDEQILWEPAIALPLVGLAVLSLLPVFHRRLKARAARPA